LSPIFSMIAIWFPVRQPCAVIVEGHGAADFRRGLGDGPDSIRLGLDPQRLFLR